VVRKRWSWIASNVRQRGRRSTRFENNSSASTKNFFRSKHHMLSQAQRTTILELHTQGIAKREIARALGISRVAVRKILRLNSNAVPELQRPEKAEPYRQQILELFEQCKGNLVRVHEELLAGGARLSYAALTAFCRRHAIGYRPPEPAGRYDFAPGEELQHDTSPHEVELAGRKRKVQTASAVLSYSRRLFFQCYPTFQRFDCKVFLTDALRYMGGAPPRVMIDNTHVVVLRGSGEGRGWRWKDEHLDFGSLSLIYADVGISDLGRARRGIPCRLKCLSRNIAVIVVRMIYLNELAGQEGWNIEPNVIAFKCSNLADWRCTDKERGTQDCQPVC
jgi:hypothetical protein